MKALLRQAYCIDEGDQIFFHWNNGVLCPIEATDPIDPSSVVALDVTEVYTSTIPTHTIGIKFKYCDEALIMVFDEYCILATVPDSEKETP